MGLTRLSVGKTIEVAFSDRKVETIAEAKVILMRNGKDLEAELDTRKKRPADLAFSLSRTPLGDIEVTISKVDARVPIGR